MLSTASHVSDKKRKRWLMLVTVWWDWNGLKRFVYSLQNGMFSTRTDCMYSNSTARASGVIWAETVTCQLLCNFFIIFFKSMWQCDTCVKHIPKFIMRIIYKSVVNKKQHWDLPAGFCLNKSWEKATNPSTFINVRIANLLLFCRVK